MKQILEHCKLISAQICGGGRKTTIYLLALGVALGAASARAEVKDLEGGTQTIDTADGLKGHTWRNGMLVVTANQSFADTTTTLGAGLTVNQTAAWWGVSGGSTLIIRDGAVVNYTSPSAPYFGKRTDGASYGGTTQITLDNGTFTSTQQPINFTAKATTSSNGKNVVVNLTMSNGSSLTAPSDQNIQFGGMEHDNKYTHNTLKVTANITASSITAKQLLFGQNDKYLETPDSSANTITFGSGTMMKLYRQLYAYRYPNPTVKFDGATINYLGTTPDEISFIGQNKYVKTDIYEILSGGLTIDIPQGQAVTTDTNASGLKGDGGVTKTGGGSITWNTITTSSPSGKMTFTGPLVVKAGSWTSSLGYAASAFRAEGGTLALSGALTATEVALAATDGGTLTLAGATLTDETPALTLAGGGTTDYFTRDKTVGAYTLASLTLGAGAELTLDAADGTGVDCITADTFTFAEGAAVSVPALTRNDPYPLFKLSSGTFASDAAAGLTVRGPTVPYTLTVDGGTIYLSIRPVVPVTVTSAGLTSLTVDNDTALMGAGGVHVDALAVADDTRLVFDPIATPIAVSGTPTFGAGAQIALAADYADVSLGRIVLMTYTGPATFDQTLFDASSIAAGASYTLTEETAPDGTSTQLVLTVGDYANDAKEIRIAPIGDSITQGIKRDNAPSFAKYPQYRTAIAARLAAHGYRPVMKGLWTFKDLSIFDAAGVRQPDDWIYHSGVSGDSVMMYKNSGGVRNNMPLYLWVAGYTDVITFFIGTNDIDQGCDVETIYTEWKKVVLKMGKMRPNAKIICATLLDRGAAGSGWKTKIPQFNNLLKADFAAGNVYPANVSYVDLYAACPLEGASNFLETTHPNWTGDDLIARAFYGKITAELPFDTFTPTTDATVTSEEQTALGAAATVPAAYRNGMTHLYTIDATEINNRFATGSSAPYTATPFAALPSRAVTKAGYYMELVHKDTNRRRWIWVDIDATGKTLDDIDFPWNDQHHYIAEKVHVASNYEGVHTVPADDDTVRGIVEFTRSSYYQPDSSHKASLSDAPANAMANHGWNDSLDGTGAGYGSFQIHRIFSAEDIAADNLDAAETLFAWNRWGNVDGIDEIGIGTYSCHAADGINNTINTTDYTSTGAGDKGLGTLSAAGYSVRHVEIWATFAEAARHGVWTGLGGNEKLSTPANWEDGQVPVAGETLNFSAVTQETTINADLDATFRAANLGTAKRRVTIGGGTLKLETLTVDAPDSNFSVAEGAKLSVAGEVTITHAEKNVCYIVYDNRGTVEIGGKVETDGNVLAYPCYNCSETATIAVSGLVSGPAGDHFKLNAYYKNAPTVNWIIGADGLSSSASGTTAFWIDRGDSDKDHGAGATLQAAADFTIAANIGARQTLNIDTGDGKTVAATGEIYNHPESGTSNNMTVSGTGRFVCDYLTAKADDRYTGDITVENGATLALNAGKIATKGQVTVKEGGTLEVAQSGTAALAGHLALEGGATLAFTFTDSATAPVLDVTGKTVTINGEIAVVLTGARPSRALSPFALTAGGKFSGATVAKGATSASWAKRVYVDENNNLAVETLPNSLVMIVW